MYQDLKQNAKIDLQENILKSFWRQFLSAASVLFFGLYTLSSIYLFLFNPSLLQNIGVYRSGAALAAVCAAAVLVGFFLFVLSAFLKYRKEVWFLFVGETCPRCSFALAVKLAALYLLLFGKKCFDLFCFLTPSAIFGGLIFVFYEKGTPQLVLWILSAADLLIFLGGLSAALIFIQRYALVSEKLAQAPAKKLRRVFRESILSMDGKCGKLFCIKLRHLPKRAASLLFFPGIYFLPYCKAAETIFASGKIISCRRRSSYTEKPIVFYFEKRPG